MEHCSLEDAVARHVRAGDTVHVVLGHHRWTALGREWARQWWDRDGGFTLVMASLGSLSTLFFRGQMLRKVVTAYSGDAFPTYGPNPVFQDAYASGAVTLEPWSFLALVQRLEAAARGLPAMVAGSIAGSDMAAHPAYAEVDSPHGRVGLLAPLAPDVTLLHAAIADRAGNVAVAPPLLEGIWGALAARRGCIVTVERVVDDITPWAHHVRIPAHRVLAVVEAPYGAHPGGVFAPSLPITAYGEDIPFWVAARDASRGDIDAFAREWCLDLTTHDAYLAKLGKDRLAELRDRADPHSWEVDEALHHVDSATPASAWETAASVGARVVEERIRATSADAVLAGAGVANLAAWVAVARARAAGSDVQLTAELGLWGYTPTPADPFIFNHRNFPTATALSDAGTVLGGVLGHPGTTSIACLGAAEVDQYGNLNSTRLADGRELVGSGGGNDAATRATEVVVVTLLRRSRTPERVAFVTGPGDRVGTVVTDLGVLRKLDGVLRLVAVPAGDLDANVRLARESCGFELAVAPDVAVLAPVTPDDVAALRRYDPDRLFLE